MNELCRDCQIQPVLGCGACARLSDKLSFQREIQELKKENDKLRKMLDEEKSLGEMVWDSMCGYCQKTIGEELFGR